MGEPQACRGRARRATPGALAWPCHAGHGHAGRARARAGAARRAGDRTPRTVVHRDCDELGAGLYAGPGTMSSRAAPGYVPHRAELATSGCRAPALRRATTPSYAHDNEGEGHRKERSRAEGLPR
jgi:hypothetical protein